MNSLYCKGRQSGVERLADGWAREPARKTRHQPRRVLALAACLLLARTAVAGLDLRNASVEHLDNGLTVILLEDRNFPVVSVQMLYKVGARNEVTGLTGIAHFVEHLAFRASANFPDTGLVSEIYARGGEWHGYTWTDQTTYFATVPREHLDLLLRIEADRMARLTIDPDIIEAERGAVLAEMHLYEDSPSSMLIDALMFTSFLAHPYRNNTIGFESDIDKLTYADVVDFYEQHYHPANGVLAVVGDFDKAAASERIRALFGSMPGRPETPLPHTKEPAQEGVRSIRIGGSGDATRFMIGYRAPSANHPDFPAFLVLQEIIGIGSGVNFRQNDWGTPVGGLSNLSGVAPELTTWFPPSAQDYIFAIGGALWPGRSEAELLAEIESRVAMARDRTLSGSTVEAAAAGVLTALTFDIETTEDAAHQLAFFEGLGALDVLLSLPAAVSAVTPEQIRAVANRWLVPRQRTIAWYAPPDASGAAVTAAAPTVLPAPGTPESPDLTPVPPPRESLLRGGATLVVQTSNLSPSAFLHIVVPGNNLQAGGVAVDSPLVGYSSLRYPIEPSSLEITLRSASHALTAMRYTDSTPPAASGDPKTLLERAFSELMGNHRATGEVAPVLVVVSGDVYASPAADLVNHHLGDFRSRPPEFRAAPPIEPGIRHVRSGQPVAQAALGYIVSAPGPRDDDYFAFRLLLYVLSHGYEGRLGIEAISRRGLAYYIDARYRSDGTHGWVTLAAGVDDNKMPSLREAFRDELIRLTIDSPTTEELDEAKAHLLGRAVSAAQSNAELADYYARHWLWFGELPDVAALEAKLAGISREDVRGVVDRFVDGRTIVVTE